MLARQSTFETVSGDQQLPESPDRAPNTLTHTPTLMPKFDGKFIKTLSAEFLVTFLFILTICANALNDARKGVNTGSVSAGVSTGMCAVAIIYAFGGLSGAHFNPAVTVGAIVGGKMDPVTGICYILVQLLAATASVGALIGLYPEKSEETLTRLLLKPNEQSTTIQAVCFEALMSFILVIIIYGSAMGLKTASDATDIESQDEQSELIANNKAKLNFAPIAIGFALGFLCFIGGTVSGGAFNPARAFGPALLLVNFSSFWIYAVGDCIGGAVAAVVYMYVLRK